MILKCKISTPQFLGSQEKYRMKTQVGEFDTKTFLFTPDNHEFNDREGSRHCVQFESMEHFKKFTVVSMRKCSQLREIIRQLLRSKDPDIIYWKWSMIVSIVSLILSLIALTFALLCS